VLKAAQDDLLVTAAVMGGAGAALYKGAIEPAAKLEAEMSNLQAVTRMSNDDLAIMKKGVRDVALEMNLSSIELAKASGNLVEIGGDTNLVLSQLEHGTKLGVATNTDLALTFDFLSAAMKTFGKDEKYTRQISDSFAYTTGMTNLTLSQLAESFVNVGGSAVNAGVDIDTINSKLVVMSEAGLKGGSAGTSLNAIFRNLTTPVGKAIDSIEELDIALYDANGSSRDMLEIMKDLEVTFANLTDEERNLHQAQIFDSVALKGWNMLMAEGFDYIAELSDEISGASKEFGGLGQAAGLVETRMDNLQGDIGRAKGELKYLSETIGDIFLPNMRDMAQGFGNNVRRAREWIEQNPETVKSIVNVTSKLALLTAGTKALNVAWLAAKGNFISLNLWKAKGIDESKNLVTAIRNINPAVAAVTVGIAALTIATEINKNAMRKLREEYADPLLFDNGGVKLSEFTDNLIDNTKFQMDNATAILNSRDRLSEMRTEMQQASSDLNFYGLSLRDNAILSKSEAADMYEPFNNFAELLEENFQIRFNTVFDNFRIASMKTAEQLGVDVKTITNILKEFESGHMQNLSESQEFINSHLQSVVDGESVSKEDWNEFHDKMNYMRGLEIIKDPQVREFNKHLERVRGVDFGADYSAGINELQRLNEYSINYKNTLTAAQKVLNNQFEELSDINEYDFKQGMITAAQHRDYSDALKIAQAMSYESYKQDWEVIDYEIQMIAHSALEQVTAAKAEIWDNTSHAKDNLNAFGAFIKSGLFTSGGYNYDYAKATYGDLYDLYGEVNRLKNSGDFLAKKANTPANLIGYNTVEAMQDIIARNEPRVTFEQFAENFQWKIIGRNPKNFQEYTMEKLDSINDTIRKTKMEDIQLRVSVDKSELDNIQDFIGSVLPREQTMAGVLRASGSRIHEWFEPQMTKRARSHAYGLDYVPFDGYIAKLHQGERVLTAQASKAYSSVVTDNSKNSPISIVYNPVITLNGDSSDKSELENILSSHKESMVEFVKNAIAEDEYNDKRMAFG
jgi:TP901 family phage tail tape measure protein